jgi:4-hydroxy-3-polyprenylbenzoate decarboxylase
MVLNYFMAKNRLIIGISGASGAVYGLRLLEALKLTDIETHLVISRAGNITIFQELGLKISDVTKLADVSYNIDDIGAAISSGSFATIGMVIMPCSVKTMSEIATGVTSNLLSRSADVVLKERRKLILSVRETPFHLGHLRTMTSLAEMGATIVPPLPAFYPHPKTLDDIVNHSVGRVLDLLGVENELVSRWKGLGK